MVTPILDRKNPPPFLKRTPNLLYLTSALNEVHKGALLLRQPTTSEVRVYFPKRLGNPETHAGKYGVNLGRNGAKLRA